MSFVQRQGVSSTSSGSSSTDESTSDKEITLHLPPFIPKQQYKPPPRRTGKRKSKRGPNPQSSSRSHRGHGSKNQSDRAGQNGKRRGQRKEVVKNPSCEIDSELGDKCKPKKKSEKNGKSRKGRKQSLKMKPVEIEQFTSDTILESSKQESSNSSQCTGGNEGSLTKQEEGLPMSSRSFTSEDEEACHNDTTTPRISDVFYHTDKMTPTDIPQSARQQSRKKKSEQATLVMSEEEIEGGTDNKQVVENHHVATATYKSAKTANTGEDGSKSKQLVPQDLHKPGPLPFVAKFGPPEEQSTPDAALWGCTIPVQMVFSRTNIGTSVEKAMCTVAVVNATAILNSGVSLEEIMYTLAERGFPHQMATITARLNSEISLEAAMCTFVEQGFPNQMVDITASLVQTKEHYQLEQWRLHRLNDSDFGFDSKNTLFRAVHVDLDERNSVVDRIIIDRSHIALNQSLLDFILILKEMVEHFLKLWYDKHPQGEQKPEAISRLNCFIGYVKYEVEVTQEVTLDMVKDILYIST